MEKNILWQFQDDLISKRDGKQILLQEVITFSYPISTMLILFLLKGLFHREEKIGEHQKKKKRKLKVDEHLISDITILLHRNSQFEFYIRIKSVRTSQKNWIQLYSNFLLSK